VAERRLPPLSVTGNGAIPRSDNRAARSLVTSFEVTYEHYKFRLRPGIDLHQQDRRAVRALEHCLMATIE
jgi:hypothetical protein